MNILIIGYGKMGKMVEEIALSKSDTIVGIIDKEEDWQTFDKNNKYKDIVAIDFSIPSKVLDNIEKAWERNIAIVVGTTGWYDKLEEITQRANQEKKTLFWASNFSIGVFLFNKLNAYLADMMKEYSDYNPSIKEIHHIHKLDAPSGTAITLAQTLVENHNIEKQNLNIESVREGEVCGTHIINYYSEVDDIEIKHTAHSRKGFASGAVMAAHWLKGKQGVFTMKDSDKSDDKVIAIPFGDPQYNGFSDISELPHHIFEELKHFLLVYKQLENKSVDVKAVHTIAKDRETQKSS